LLKSYQKLYITSLIAKLKTVRDVIGSYSFGFLKDDQFIFTAEEKLSLALNLDYGLDFTDNYNDFLVSKKKSLSFFFQFPGTYDACVKLLCSETISPVVDTLSERINVNFRPYRSCQDVYLQIKTLVFKVNKPFWFLVTEMSSDFVVVEWLIKNFPFEKTFLKKCLKLFKIDNHFFNCNENKIDNLFYVFFDFLLNGLVRYIKSIVTFSFLVNKST